MNSSISVRKARLKDIPEILKMWKVFMSEHDMMVVSKNPSLKPHYDMLKTGPGDFERYARNNIHSKNAIIFLAEKDGKIIGYCLCRIKRNIPIFKVTHLGHIGDLYVKKEYRKLGISSMFKNEALKWFKSKGIKYSSIMVSPENSRARGIYKKWGFTDYHLELRKRI